MKKNSIAIINYELGKLYSCHELEESNFKRRGQILSNKSKRGIERNAVWRFHILRCQGKS
jgi:hypothetical protein